MLRRLAAAVSAASIAILLIVAFAFVNDRGGMLAVRDLLDIGSERIPTGQQAKASQATICIPTAGTLSGLVAVQDMNAALAAIVSTNSGASAPANDCSAAAVKGQLWLDTSTNLLKIYDGTNWLPISLTDGTNHVWTPPVGGGTATLASAGTTDLWSVSQAAVTVTGTTGITAFASASAVPGTLKVVKFTGALTLTYNATSLILPTAASITTAAGDYAFVLALTNTNVAIVDYVRATGAAVLPAAFGTLTNLASATTTDLGSIASHNVNVTGTTTITGFGSSALAASPVFLVKFAAALQLTYNASSMILPGASNITTAANDTAVASYLGSGNWQVLAYNRATANVVGKAPTVQVLTSGSGATYTAPTNPSPLYIVVKMVGGGGGGAARLTNAGTAGNTTSFASWTALGGGGGTAGGSGGAGGTGGATGTGVLIAQTKGSDGVGAIQTAAGVTGLGGAGGNSGCYAGGGAKFSGGTGADAAGNSGGGGQGGGASASNSGGGGGGGECMEFLVSPAPATATYTVAAAANGGAAGGAAGGNGALGKITVFEYYQ